MHSKNILILAAHVPFSRGGAERLLDSLQEELIRKGHSVDILGIPFICNSKDDLIKNIIQWRSLNLEYVNGRKIDLVICTKFPTYYAIHSHKIIWLIHQYRQAYDLFATRFGDFDVTIEDEAIRKAIHRYDSIAFSEAKKIYTISQNVSDRLKKYNNFESVVLEPPVPLRIDTEVAIHKGSYILCIGRISSIKRIDLILKALPLIPRDITLSIVGKEDEPGVMSYLEAEIEKHGIKDRVIFHGSVDDVTLNELYAKAFCVYFGAYDEDYGFVTYEACKFKKPIIALSDGGHIASIVKRYNLGVVSDPTSDMIASHVSTLWTNNELYDEFVSCSRRMPDGLSWDKILEQLILF